MSPLRLDRLGVVFLVLTLGAAVACAAHGLGCRRDSALRRPPYVVALLGKYLCYAMLAVALDLVWGYCGILSLGHGAFFALGGYAMGMYLMRQIGTRGVYANPILPDFMVFLNWKELPVAWWGFHSFAYASLMVMLVPGLLAFAFGWFAFRSRVTGVYLSIITQALTYALKLAFFRNDFGFGGNNGLTDFKDILGFNVQSDATRTALFSISALALALSYLVAKAIVSSKYGKALIAVRDAESRMRFLGYRVENYKLFVFVVSAVMAGVAGALYVPQVGIINPSEFAPGQFDRGRDLGRGRRARHAGRRGARRGRGQFRQDLFHRRLPGILALWPRRAVRAGDPVPAQGHDRPHQVSPQRARRRAGDRPPRSQSRRARNDPWRRPKSQAHQHAALSRRRQRFLRRLSRRCAACR